MRIPRTYDGEFEDSESRRTGLDFWAWLRDQPQHTWLFYVRGGNWDNADTIFMEMVAHPACNRAIASWLFWHTVDLEEVRSGKRHSENSVLGRILIRCERGGFPRGDVHYDRSEVALAALQFAMSLRELDHPASVAVPLELIDNFDGSNPPIGPFSAELEADLTEIFDEGPGRHSGIWGTLYRSDGDYFENQEKRGNRWFVGALELPKRPVVTAALSPLERIRTLFGDEASALARIESARMASRQKRALVKRGWAGRMALYFVAGIGALIGSLHLFGPVAATVVLVAWLAAAFVLRI